MTSVLPGATFRDPAGSLSFEDNQVIRRIDPSARAAVLDLLESPFCASLQKDGLLIAAEIEDSGTSLCLRHPKIPIPTYPWEWTPTQWLEAAELTLDLCQRALADGWILKDATPLNVLFSGTKPIFVDILSFERRDKHSSIWLAYGQYIRTFLLPLLMNRILAWPLSLSLFKRDGYEPADCYAALGWRRRLGREALWPITLPTLLDRRKSANTQAKKRPLHTADPNVTADVLKRTLNDLRKRTRRAMPELASSEWSDYPDTLTHYSPDDIRQKMDWVRHTLEATRPRHVLDIGANTGEFSALAAESNAAVTALERDMAAADRLHRMAKQRNLSIQGVCADIARPSPAVGWENNENIALLPRLEGHFELVLMLAVIHHLILMEQIPLPAILALCHRLTLRHLIIEWVPVEDPMFQSLLRGRESLYGSLKEDDLTAACVGRFSLLDRKALGNGRVLFLFEKITSC